MGALNLGNVVGLVKSETPPVKTFVMWAKILNPVFPNVVELNVFDADVLQWVPLKFGYIKITKSFTDFATGAAANDISLVNLPAGYKFEELITKHSIEFAGGSTASAGVTVGVAGELDKYVFGPLDIFAAPAGDGFSQDNVNTIEDWDANTDIRAEVTITGDTLDNVTQGEIEFFILIKRVKQ